LVKKKKIKTTLRIVFLKIRESNLRDQFNHLLLKKKKKITYNYCGKMEVE